MEIMFARLERARFGKIHSNSSELFAYTFPPKY